MQLRAAGVLLLILAAVLAGPAPRACAAPDGLPPLLGLPFDGQWAMDALTTQCGFGPRVPGTEAHDACRAWLLDQLRECCDQVTDQEFQAAGAPVMHNIIGVINPAGHRTILLGAHWDSAPRALRDPDPALRSRPVPGANDGASGVAVLLGLARAWRVTPPDVRVIVALFDGEDWGDDQDTMCLGSNFFVAHPGPWQPQEAIIVDMVGAVNLRIPQEPASRQAALWLMDRIWAVAARRGDQCFESSFGPMLWDDQSPFIQAGIPAVAIAGWNYEAWHTTRDTPSMCSGQSLEAVGSVLQEVVAGWEPRQP